MKSDKAKEAVLTQKILEVSKQHPDWSCRQIALEVGTYREKVRLRLNADKKKNQIRNRICLKCGKPFASEWKGNRICEECIDLVNEVVI